MTAIQPHEMTRELKLKLALARLLPDDIEVTDLCNFRWRRGPYAGEMIRDTEWEHIARIFCSTGSEFGDPTWQEMSEDLLNRMKIEWDKP